MSSLERHKRSSEPDGDARKPRPSVFSNIYST